MGKRASAEEIRSHVSSALLNINRPDLLEDSALLGILGIRVSGSLWAGGRALRQLLQEAVAGVANGLADIPAMSPHRSLLQEVALEGKSLSQWSRERGRSREGVSRGPWRDVTEWVADELERLSLLTSTANPNR